MPAAVRWEQESPPQTFLVLLLHVKKCTEIWECVAQKKKRLIAKEPSPKRRGQISAYSGEMLQGR